MSNRVDFFQSAQTCLSLPIAGVSILVDGSYCPYLEPIEIVQASWPEFSWVRLAYNPAAYSGSGVIAVEQIEHELATGRAISIRQIYNGGVPGVGIFGFPIFDGQIEGIEKRLGPGGERVEIIAKDFSANLRRIIVYGQRVCNPDGTTLLLSAAATIFNAESKGNAETAPTDNKGRSYTLFCAEPSRAKLWSCAEAIYYLLCEHIPVGQLGIPTVEQLKVLTDNQALRDLDVMGMNLIDALQQCCEQVGLEFRFVSRPVPVGPSQAIVFFKSGRGRAVELSCQRSGEQFSISKTNVIRLHSNKSFWPVTHRYIGQGDFTVHEATFELVKAWDSADEGTDYDKFSSLTNADFYKVKDVFRKWCLNEAGDYSEQPYNRGESFDFSKIFGSANFARRRRRFWPALTRDKQGRSLGYFLQVSFDDGLHWWQYLYAFNNLLDECGVWLSSDRLDVNTWVAALKGVLKFRVTASVVSDERLSCQVADGPVGSVAPVVEHIISKRQFKYRKVSSWSIFANVNGDSLGEPDEIDDSASLYEFVRKKAQAASEPIETIDVQTPYLASHYQVGDRVNTSAESRDLLCCRSDNRSITWIRRVQMDFGKQCTNLKIVRQRRSEL